MRRPPPLLAPYVRGRTAGTDAPVYGYAWQCPVAGCVWADTSYACVTKTQALRVYGAHYRQAHPHPKRPRSTQHAVMEPFPGTTLADAKEWLRGTVDDGATCPCCQQLARVYRRPINSAMAAKLIQFYRRHHLEWGQSPKLIAGARDAGGDFAKLRYWDLVEESAETRADGGRAGWWRVTERGQAFVLGDLHVPHYVVLYNGRRLRMEGQRRTITDALGEKFDYNALMGRPL